MVLGDLEGLAFLGAGEAGPGWTTPRLNSFCSSRSNSSSASRFCSLPRRCQGGWPAAIRMVFVLRCCCCVEEEGMKGCPRSQAGRRTKPWATDIIRPSAAATTTTRRCWGVALLLLVLVLVVPVVMAWRARGWSVLRQCWRSDERDDALC